MDSSVSPKDEIWFLRVCHHISPGLYCRTRWLLWNFGRKFVSYILPTQPPVQWLPDLSRGKAAGAWLWPPTTSSAEVKERVELYLYSPSGPSWPVLGWTVPLPFIFCPSSALIRHIGVPATPKTTEVQIKKKKEPSQSSRRQTGDVMQIVHLRPQNIKLRRSKFSLYSDVMTGICVSVPKILRVILIIIKK